MTRDTNTMMDRSHRCRTVYFGPRPRAITPTRMRVPSPISFTFTPSKNYGLYTPGRQSRPSMPSQVPDDGRTTIDLTDDTDRWRYTCPNGHRQWEPTNHHFWCASCARQRDAEATFHALRDRRDGRRLERVAVRLLTDKSAYDRDLDAGGVSADD